MRPLTSTDQAERKKPSISWSPVPLEAVTEKHKKKSPGMSGPQGSHGDDSLLKCLLDSGFMAWNFPGWKLRLFWSVFSMPAL